MVLHRGAMLKHIYDWCIDAAHKPYALWIMGLVSFAESSFFPVPPDVMLIPMSLARPERAWLYAAVCTATSVLGGVVGYAIGAAMPMLYLFGCLFFRGLRYRCIDFKRHAALYFSLYGVVASNRRIDCSVIASSNRSATIMPTPGIEIISGRLTHRPCTRRRRESLA